MIVHIQVRDRDNIGGFRLFHPGQQNGECPVNSCRGRFCMANQSDERLTMLAVGGITTALLLGGCDH